MKSDEQLMESVRDGALGQLSVLFERYHQPLFKYCIAIGGSAHIAEDCVQEAFRRTLQYRKSYRSGVFKVWLYRIARNVAMDLLPDQPAPEPDEAPYTGPGPELLAISGQDAELLRASLMCIRPSYREVLVLARFQELTSREIASIIGVEEATVRVRLYRALKALAKEFKGLTLEQDHRNEQHNS